MWGHFVSASQTHPSPVVLFRWRRSVPTPLSHDALEWVKGFVETQVTEECVLRLHGRVCVSGDRCRFASSLMEIGAYLLPLLWRLVPIRVLSYRGGYGGTKCPHRGVGKRPPLAGSVPTYRP